MAKRHDHLLDRKKSILIVVDIQERLISHMFQKDLVLKNTLILVKAARLLNIPILYSEQYPKGLGDTSGELKDFLLPSECYTNKLSFSCFGHATMYTELLNQGRKQMVITGIESHVCVSQTALDAIYYGFNVHVPIDAVSSRFELNHETALKRLDREGADLSTTEAVIFEWLYEAGTVEFKEISKMVK